jgi:hypothetical protein
MEKYIYTLILYQIMAKSKEFKAIQDEFKYINIKIAQALRIRNKILDRIKNACDALLKNPSDKKARDSLMINLDRERNFLDIIKRGSKKAISSLKEIKKKLSVIEGPKKVKATMETLIDNLIDSMWFTQKKIRIISKRVRQGEKLEYKDYADKHINNFLVTLEEEKQLDLEIVARLKGDLPKIITPLQAMAERLGIAGASAMFGGFLIGGLVTRMVQADQMSQFQKVLDTKAASWASVPLATSVLTLFIGATFVLGWLGGIAYSAEKEKEIESEVKKILAKEQASK